MFPVNFFSFLTPLSAWPKDRSCDMFGVNSWQVFLSLLQILHSIWGQPITINLLGCLGSTVNKTPKKIGKSRGVTGICFKKLEIMRHKKASRLYLARQCASQYGDSVFTLAVVLAASLLTSLQLNQLFNFACRPDNTPHYCMCSVSCVFNPNLKLEWGV